MSDAASHLVRFGTPKYQSQNTQPFVRPKRTGTFSRVTATLPDTDMPNQPPLPNQAPVTAVAQAVLTTPQQSSNEDIHDIHATLPPSPELQETAEIVDDVAERSLSEDDTVSESKAMAEFERQLADTLGEAKVALLRNEDRNVQLRPEPNASETTSESDRPAESEKVGEIKQNKKIVLDALVNTNPTQLASRTVITTPLGQGKITWSPKDEATFKEYQKSEESCFKARNKLTSKLAQEVASIDKKTPTGPDEVKKKAKVYKEIDDFITEWQKIKYANVKARQRELNNATMFLPPISKSARAAIKTANSFAQSEEELKQSAKDETKVFKILFLNAEDIKKEVETKVKDGRKPDKKTAPKSKFSIMETFVGEQAIRCEQEIKGLENKLEILEKNSTELSTKIETNTTKLKQLEKEIVNLELVLENLQSGSQNDNLEEINIKQSLLDGLKTDEKQLMKNLGEDKEKLELTEKSKKTISSQKYDVWKAAAYRTEIGDLLFRKGERSK